MKTKRKYFYLDDFEHRLLVGCLMTARNEYIHEDKPIEDVNELILKIIDAPSKKLRVIVKEGITETLKAENQMEWVQKMNDVRNVTTEIINQDLIYR